MKFLVLMPTFNERQNLENSVLQVLQAVPGINLLIIDDNSPDGTGAIADKLSEENSEVSVLHRESKKGLGRAYLDGFTWAAKNSFDFVIQMDADGSHQPKNLSDLISKARPNRLVIGSRWIPGGEVLNWPWYRKVISRFGNLYARRMLGTKVMDMTAGYRLYPVSSLAKMKLQDVQAQGYGFQIEMTLLAIEEGLEVVEVPISFVERTVGKSKMTMKIVLEAFWLCTKWGIRR
ncbi:polyprenol monophosphomannose synthase [Aquiluna sp.]|jgi:dolichol-phosphate mannosyltransferase|nr:polyprenol monophosphomannose synthase [Aquiluna sp.]MDA7760905.1 polyprenol monophosphomannose synthase [Aquiluna sp.]MDB4018320.1 polyprenol monophosphomannose synthase [Aquiluna sp.]MDB4254428.1 polyprenol monophosphomannose synthase [Aquiluna sp.]